MPFGKAGALVDYAEVRLSLGALWSDWLLHATASLRGGE
jgi:hypothetical protein